MSYTQVRLGTLCLSLLSACVLAAWLLAGSGMPGPLAGFLVVVNLALVLFTASLPRDAAHAGPEQEGLPMVDPEDVKDLP